MNYFQWMIIFMVLPIGIIYFLDRKLFQENLPVLYRTALGSIVLGFFWELVSVNSNVWSYSHTLLSGLNILSVPLEEFLFYVLATFLVSSLTIFLLSKDAK